MDILLIWNHQSNPPEYYFFSKDKIPFDLFDSLEKACNHHFSEQNSDELDAHLWNIKAAISSENTWVPRHARDNLAVLFESYVSLPLRRNVSYVFSVGK